MPAARTLVGLALIFALAACSGGGAAASITPPPQADATITAKDHAFDPGTLTLPAGKSTEVFFKNLDGDAHNVAVYSDASATSKLFGGQVITNAATLYELPALPAGSYVFRCDVHTNMTGTLVVTG